MKMISNKFMNMREVWYNTAAVKFEMRNFLVNREAALLLPKHVDEEDQTYKSIRMLKIHNVGHLDTIFKAYLVSDKLYNVYSTVATYAKGIPNQSLNLSERDNNWWKGLHHERMVAYDLFIDIDASDHTKEEMMFAWESAKDIKKILDGNNIPYEIRFSGCGFHFIVPYRFFTCFTKEDFDPGTEENIYMRYARIAKWLYETGSEMVDRSIYDSRRLCKTPYSIAIYEDDMYVCLPIISEEQFENFNPEDYRLDSFTQYQKSVYMRGTKMFNPDGNVKFLERIMRGETNG